MTPVADRFVDVVARALMLLLELVPPAERDVVVARLCAKLHSESAKRKSWIGPPPGKDGK